MPSGNGGMGRGSDTRIYAPRSESNHMYSNNDEDSYRHGIGDKEEFERKRDEKIRQKEETKTVGDMPHLRIEIDKPEEEPMMEDMGSPQEEENPDMYNPEQAAAQTDMSSMAGPIGIGGPNLSQAIGAQTNGVMQQFATGEPMEDAWSTLMKSSLKNIKPKQNKPWQQPKYDGPPGGRRPDLATSLRSSRQARTLSPRTEHGGQTESPLAVEMGHLGLSTKQPLRLFPGKYRQQLGQRQQRALMGNISMPHQPHNVEQRTPTKPGFMGSGRIPRLAGEMKKAELKEMGMLLKSAKDYLHISQLRRIIRDMKKIVERQDRMKKGSNKNKKAGHRGESTNPQGATDDPESDEMSSSGMPGHVFAARGSGRVA
tara:strand:- start:2066 stop:3175 length:1110 start_codon:yes stop_codon:yes gene_type:complete